MNNHQEEVVPISNAFFASEEANSITEGILTLSFIMALEITVHKIFFRSKQRSVTMIMRREIYQRITSWREVKDMFTGYDDHKEQISNTSSNTSSNNNAKNNMDAFGNTRKPTIYKKRLIIPVLCRLLLFIAEATIIGMSGHTLVPHGKNTMHDYILAPIIQEDGVDVDVDDDVNDSNGSNVNGIGISIGSNDSDEQLTNNCRQHFHKDDKRHTGVVGILQTCIKTQTDSKQRTIEDNFNNNNNDQEQWFEIDVNMKCSTNEFWFEIMSNQFETDPYSSEGDAAFQKVFVEITYSSYDSYSQTIMPFTNGPKPSNRSQSQVNNTDVDSDGVDSDVDSDVNSDGVVDSQDDGQGQGQGQSSVGDYPPRYDTPTAWNEDTIHYIFDELAKAIYTLSPTITSTNDIPTINNNNNFENNENNYKKAVILSPLNDLNYQSQNVYEMTNGKLKFQNGSTENVTSLLTHILLHKLTLVELDTIPLYSFDPQSGTYGNEKGGGPRVYQKNKISQWIWIVCIIVLCLISYIVGKIHVEDPEFYLYRAFLEANSMDARLGPLAQPLNPSTDVFYFGSFEKEGLFSRFRRKMLQYSPLVNNMKKDKMDYEQVNNTTPATSPSSSNGGSSPQENKGGLFAILTSGTSSESNDNGNGNGNGNTSKQRKKEKKKEEKDNNGQSGCGAGSLFFSETKTKKKEKEEDLVEPMLCGINLGCFNV